MPHHRIRLRFALIAGVMLVTACDAPPGAAMYRCKVRMVGLLRSSHTCVFTLSPLDSAGYTHLHEDKGFGSSTAYTDAIAVKGTLSVARGEVRLDLVDERGTTRTVTATPGAPAPFALRLKTKWRSSIRGLPFSLTPIGATHSADSLRLEYEFVH